MTMRAFAADLQTAAMHRAQFVANVLAITGDTRLFWLPEASDTTTSTDKSLNARTITHTGGSLATRLSALGLGYAVSFNGTTQYSSAPDADSLSFGDSSTDSAFSILALANPTNSAADRGLVAKFTGGAAREYILDVDSSDRLRFRLFDESVDAEPLILSAITQDAWGLMSASYSAATGGATAADDMTLYRNGAPIGSPTNAGTYVAMENAGSVVTIGANSTSLSAPFVGSIAFAAIVSGVLTPSQNWALKTLCNAYFGLSL